MLLAERTCWGGAWPWHPAPPWTGGWTPEGPPAPLRRPRRPTVQQSLRTAPPNWSRSWGPIGAVCSGLASLPEQWPKVNVPFITSTLACSSSQTLCIGRSPHALCICHEGGAQIRANVSPHHLQFLRHPRIPYSTFPLHTSPHPSVACRVLNFPHK